MEHEEQFYSELKNIPDVPEDVYPEIVRKTGQRRLAIRSGWLAAACLVLVIGGIYYFQFNANHKNAVAMAASQELQYIEDYFNYSDIVPDSTLYTSNGFETEEELSTIIDYFFGDNIQEDVDMYAIIDNDFL